MKVSTENDNNFGYEKITILVDNMSLMHIRHQEQICRENKVLTGDITGLVK